MDLPCSASCCASALIAPEMRRSESVGHCSTRLPIVWNRETENAGLWVVCWTQYQGPRRQPLLRPEQSARSGSCLLYTSDAADEEDSVDLGGRRIIKKKKTRT